MTDSSKLLLPLEGVSKIDLFQKKEIRKLMHKGEWWFSVKDVIEALVETKNGNDYVRQLRNRDPGLQEGWRQIVVTLPFQSTSGIQNTNFVNIEGLFRLMQSVPSKKAEPFKKWLAKVGFERLQEIQNPDLAIKRATTLYRAKGYDDEWIEARIRNKASRDLLTSEWNIRGMRNYIGLLTDSISIETFGVSTAEHKQVKGLKKQSLRDNMTPIELTLTTLGEQATTEIIKARNPKSLFEHKDTSVQGGRIAGSARQQIELATDQKVLSSKNYLTSQQRKNNAIDNKEVNEAVKKLFSAPQPEPTIIASDPLKKARKTS